MKAPKYPTPIKLEDGTHAEVCCICKTGVVSGRGCCPYHTDSRIGYLQTDNSVVRPYSLRRVYLNQGGYEYGKYGQYFGHGAPLYRAVCEIDGLTHEVRAVDRADAMRQIHRIGVDSLATFRR